MVDAESREDAVTLAADVVLFAYDPSGAAVCAVDRTRLGPVRRLLGVARRVWSTLVRRSSRPRGGSWSRRPG